MRTVIGAAVLALGMAAQPAFAGEGAASVQGIAAPLPSFSASLTPGIVGEIAGGITGGIASGLVGPALADLRLPTVTMAPTAPVLSTDDAGMLRRRFTGTTMMEFYPVEGSGFHLSGGTRLYSRRNFAKETEDSAQGALSVTHSIAAPMVTRPGLRRFNPALTAGYTLALSTMMRLGVEGGAMMGHLFASAPGLPHDAFGYHGDNAVRANAVANMVFGMRF